MPISNISRMPAEHPLDAVARVLPGGRKQLADGLGVSTAAVGNWKKRGVPVEKCTLVERIAGGFVTRKDLRPDDWADIWPELVPNIKAQPSSREGVTNA